MRKLSMLLASALAGAFPLMAGADYRADIGHAALVAALGAATPTGAGVRVTQVEANGGNDPSDPLYLPFVSGTSNSLFTGKTLYNRSPYPDTNVSGHAEGVGAFFYGNGAASIAPGITTIDAYSADDWLGPGFLKLGVVPFALPAISPARVANHSWIGDYEVDSLDSSALRRLDWLIQRDESIQVVATSNGGSNLPLLSGSYNAIAVGRTDGGHGQGTVGIPNTIYTAGRTKPDLVAPLEVTSLTTPVVAAAAALLVEVGHAGAGSLSHGSTTNRNSDVIYNAERAVTIKAALMAGADRETANTSTAANITDYRAAGFRSDNGLDTRYGAGQLNVYNAYHIIAAGERDSQQDGDGAIGPQGFDYDPSFGGTGGSNRTGSYLFDTNGLEGATLSASLVWNLAFTGSNLNTATLHNLDLYLFDLADPEQPLASSTSTLDNTENLWLSLFSGRQYELRVTAAGTGTFAASYALAWNIAPVPLPAGVWLFVSALIGLWVVNRRRRPSPNA